MTKSAASSYLSRSARRLLHVCDVGEYGACLVQDADQIAMAQQLCASGLMVPVADMRGTYRTTERGNVKRFKFTDGESTDAEKAE